MIPTTIRNVVLASSLLAVGCAANEEPFADTTFQLAVASDVSATLSIETNSTWHANTISADRYTGFSTRYDRETWEHSTGNLDLSIEQHGSWPAVTMSLDGSPVVAMSWLELGPNWLGIHRNPNEPAPALDLDDVGIDKKTDCVLSDARVLMSLSRYAGTAEELIGIATASAERNGLPAPTSWHDVVIDPEMYDFLFVEHATTKMWHATFAFLAIHLDPLCGDTRFALRSENELVGFVER